MNDNTVVFVTGAGSGLGQLSAKRALDKGWLVAAMDVNGRGLEELGESSNLLKIEADITIFDQVHDAVERCEAELGPITRVINAAAIMPLGLLSKQPRELIHKVMSINYGGLVNIVDAVLPRMVSRGRGQFISYASMAGHWPVLYMGAYNASKHAVAAYTEVLYHETLNTGVRVLCVCPPIVSTPLLEQAKNTTWPKIFDVFPPITPDSVLDEVERAIPGKKLWVFPGPLTRIVWLMRRWFPNLLWWRVHSIEGI